MIMISCRDGVRTAWKIALGHAILLLTFVTNILFLFETQLSSSDMGFCTLFFVEAYWRLVSSHLFWEVTNIIEIRYRNVNSMLKNTFSSNMMNLLEVRLRLKKIKSSFAQLNSTLQDISVVFGATIFFNLALPTVRLLYTICIYSHNSFKDSKFNVVFVTMSTTIYILMYCSLNSQDIICRNMECASQISTSGNRRIMRNPCVGVELKPFEAVELIHWHIIVALARAL
ncbi:hypothetical protein JTB14_012788 [Gonioctena quinquepunctata]|nr:hypothetical protein JTB14_012788 [Gonioctena quinquepunctata]